MFPSSEAERLRRKPAARDEREARDRKQHFWSYEAGKWRCTICNTWAVEDGPTAKQKAATCAGNIGDKHAAQWTVRGHVLSKVGGPLPFVFCRRCGAWGSRRARHLERHCGTPTPAGALALRRIENGKHPWRRKLEGGGGAPRVNIAVTETYDRSTGSWRKLAKKDVSGKRRPTTVPARRTNTAVVEAIAMEEGPAGAPPEIQTIVEAYHSFGECEEDPFGHGGSLAEEPATIGHRMRADGGSNGNGDGHDVAPATGCGAADGVSHGGIAPAHSCETGRADTGPSCTASGGGASSSGLGSAPEPRGGGVSVGGNSRDRGADVAARLAGLRSRVLSRGTRPRVNQGLRGWEGCFPSSQSDFSIPLSSLHGHPHHADDRDNVKLGRRGGPRRQG